MEIYRENFKWNATHDFILSEIVEYFEMEAWNIEIKSIDYRNDVITFIRFVDEADGCNYIVNILKNHDDLLVTVDNKG